MASLTVCVAATKPPMSPPPPGSPLSSPRSRLTPPPWINLPCEVTALILQKLGTVEILRNARRVCTTWLNICKDPAMFRVIDIDDNYEIYDRLKLFRYAVDLSQGQLVDITFPRRHTDKKTDQKMIDYIAKQSPKLRCLRMTLYNITCIEALSEDVKKFPLLEEMHLNYHSEYNEAFFQTTIEISSCCPLLTSFSLIAVGDAWDNLYTIPDLLPSAVSKMSKLRHLRVIGSIMTNEGLTAILDSCCQLESLELRKCPYLELDSELRERCRQQIKHLELPKDSELRKEEVEWGKVEGVWDTDYNKGEGVWDTDYNNMLTSEEKWRCNMDERIESMTASIDSLTASIDGINAKLDYLITLHQQIRDSPQPT